jgi:signal peptidase II
MIDRFTKGSGLLGQSDKSKGSMSARRAPIYRDFLLIQLAVLVFLADQFSKYLVREFLVLYESFPAQGFLRVTHTFNTGSIFGLFQGQNTPLILVSFIGVAVLILLYRSQRFPTGLLRLSLGLQLGGAFGNLVDRVRLGAVTDWVDIGPWPVFNVADASIVTGLIILAWLFVMSERSTAGGSPEADGYGYCPVCDGDMRAITGGGWRCSTCGVREKVLVLPQSSPGDSLL